MKRLATLVVLVVMCFTYTWAQKAQPEKTSKEVDRVESAQKVLNEIMATPDKGIPAKILSTADCVAIVPSMLKVGFGFGGRYGKGIATCREGNTDHWTAPVPIRIEGGSWGLQFGGQAVDLVMVFANRKGLDQLLTSKFKIGGDAGAAAGPVGRDASAGTDWKLRSQILTYSRSRGVFAGVDLNGSAIKQDTDDTLALYGNKFVPYEQILSGKVTPPASTRPFLAEIAKYFRESKEGDVVANKNATPSGAKSSSTTASHHAGTTGTAEGVPASNDTQSGSTGSVGASTGTSGSQSTTTTTETTSQDQTGRQTSAGSGSSADQVKSNIQNALRNTPNLDASNVSIDVTNDSVILSGSVPDNTARGTVKRIAQDNADGRKVVDDNLTVK